MQTELFTDEQIDDLFTPHAAQPYTATRRCRYCDLPYVVALDYDGPPFCANCLADVPALRRQIRAEIDRIQTQELAAPAAWDAAREPQQADWDAIQARSGEADYAARCADHRARKTKYGKLLDAHAAYLAALAPLAERRDALERAMEEL